MTRPDGNASFDNLIANTAGVNVIAPTWYELTDNEGGFNSFADAEYVLSLIHIWHGPQSAPRNVPCSTLLKHSPDGSSNRIRPEDCIRG